MKRSTFLTILITLTCAGLFIPEASCPAWVGLEIDAKATGVEDPYGAGGPEGSGSLWEFSGRVMFQKSFGKLDTEIHWLGQSIHSAGDLSFSILPPPSPFRSLDMERVHSFRGGSALVSEIDRLLLTFNEGPVSLTAGRQAVTWGEAYFFNIGDLFGAFPVTETNRRYKSGIDAFTADVNLGPFSSLHIADVPVDGGRDNAAAHILWPLGEGTVSATWGRVRDSDKAGAGYTVDVAGTQIYGSLLLTRTSGNDRYTQAVLGAQRQLGPYTSLIGELYRNGLGAEDPNDYAALLATEEYRYGNALTLGRHSVAVQVSRQVSPLVTLTPALFGNLSDGSALLRMDGAYSVSDFTDLTGGLFIGLGERPEGGFPRSEYGAVPVSIYVELVHNI